ncbi:hypothetical protein V5799_008935 [Amblyomma americanum]|uniref:G-protein coupled receptors family 1 profile domain-containing protein n=1 Tax=Amblyomma americanum TaxID=6943 RepID=A0AAQ4FC14_AMBAM
MSKGTTPTHEPSECVSRKLAVFKTGFSKENNSTTSEDACEVDAAAYPRQLSYFAGGCGVLFAALGVPGNLLTLLALGRSRRLRSATTAFVMSLCCADLLFCAVNLPMTATRYFRRCWMFGDTMCAVFGFFFYGNVATSILSMTGITVTRTPEVHVLSSILSWMSCCVNPFVYAVMNRQYRRSYVALLCPQRGRKQDFRSTVVSQNLQATAL